MKENAREVYIGRVGHKVRAGRYIEKLPKMSKDKYRDIEERSFRGDRCQGVPVSTDRRLYGVICRTAKGKKLLSKHETLAAAAAWIDEKEGVQ